MPQVNFKLGDLDLVLKPALSYSDVKRMKGCSNGELAKKDPWAVIDLVVELLWKCAHVSDPAITKEQIEDNLVMPAGVEAVMIALLQVVGTVPNDVTVV
jgi:hypothetical protein